MPPVRIITSRKRRRTVAARMRSGVLELMVPASMPHVERQHWAEVMARRLERRAERSRPTDERLEQRARQLNDRHFGGALRWRSIGFADMERQWGSCSFTDGAIRIARRAAALPDWVLDHLLVHELAHLVHSDHGREFHELENRYPLTERAKGYLLALDEHSRGSQASPAVPPPLRRTPGGASRHRPGDGRSESGLQLHLVLPTE